MAKPIIKWVGGKSQLLTEIKNRMPEIYNTYYEPFFGGGALYFSVLPKKAIINDFNTQLINLYRCLKNESELVKAELLKLQNEYNQTEDKQTYFYKIRDAYNTAILNNALGINVAAYFIFLNKLCFNGLYRTNKKGLFNTPWNKAKKVNLIDEDNFKLVCEALQIPDIYNTDFEEVCKTANTNDFVFFDSPYYDTFDTYQKGGFSEESHIRLANLFKQLTQKGVKCMLTNSNTDFIKNLYSDYNITIVPVKRMINSDAKNRVGEEIIITNY